MLTVVAFKWKPQGGHYRSSFGADQVIVLRNMVQRNYKKPHRFVCITDDASGLAGEGVETIPLWSDYAEIPSPHGGGNPSCYRRLKLFDPAIKGMLGERFIALDLDTVIVGDVAPIFDRTEPFVMWGETDPRSWYNGSMMLMTAGSRAKVWTDFNPNTSPRQALKAGRFGSDQGWISHVLGKGEATWGRKDGVYSYRVHLAPVGNDLPDDARIVFFHGKHDPWAHSCQQIPWVKAHWR